MRLKMGILSLGLLSVAQGVFAAPQSENLRIIVKYKQQTIAATALKSKITTLTQLPVKQMTPMANGAYVVILDTSHSNLKPTESTDRVLTSLRKNPNVQYAVKDRVGYFKPLPDPVATDISEDLAHANQWNEFERPAGVMLESAPGKRDGAWAYTNGHNDKQPVVVAVLDTGIAMNDSIVNNLVKDADGNVFGWNFAGNNADLTDETKSYHGTHVAGIIAGYGSIMQGMGEELKILTLKIPAESGMFYESAVVNAIYWSVGGDVPGVPKNNYPAKVLNMSFGVDEKPGKEIDHCDEALQEAIFFARKKGAVLAVAAGNDNEWEHYNAPAVCNGTIKVASTGPEGLRSYFTNYGPTITFAAPGGDKRYGKLGGILSTVNPGGGDKNSGFDFYQGTSMASPHVAGVAGLVFAASEKNLTPMKLEQILYTTTHDFGKSNEDNKSCVGKKPCGHGILDAKSAVKAVIDDFDVLLSAPAMASLDAKGCGKAGMLIGKDRITTGSAVWVKTHASCETALSYQHPTITQGKEGQIVAHYGATTYQLDLSVFKACEVIGYDGVGCYS